MINWGSKVRVSVDVIGGEKLSLRPMPELPIVMMKMQFQPVASIE